MKPIAMTNENEQEPRKSGRKPREVIGTIDRLIEIYDGPSRMAEYFNLSSPSAITNWRRNNCVSKAMSLKIYLDVKRRGYEIAPDLIHLDE